jgi:predicted glycosyltransferase
MLNLVDYPSQQTLNLRKRSSIKVKPLKIILYSHDTMGLGHKRRNILIAQALASSALPTEILLITGSHTASDFIKTSGIDCLALPELFKTTDGVYKSKNLNLSFKQITQLRSQIIKETVIQFKPDVLITDNIPRGAGKELNPTLKYLKGKEKTYCILGLRDILDQPEIVARDWQNVKNEKAIRKYYDEIWVYGDSAIYDIRQQYNFAPDIVNKINYVGYLDQRPRMKYFLSNNHKTLNNFGLPLGKFALCLLGGGQDGTKLAHAFVQAKFPEDMVGVLVTGPLMAIEERQKLYNYVSEHQHLFLIDYLPEPTLLLAQAERVIAMGGYNTTCEVLSFQKKALILPRIKPRLEQFIRAKIFQDLGLIDMIHPEEINSQSLSKWLHLENDSHHSNYNIDFNGCDRLVKMLEDRFFLSTIAS